MSKEIVPEEINRAAKRGFVRTTSQALAASLTGGLAASTVITFVQEFDPIVSSIVLVTALVSPLIAGAASYFDIIGRGIPEDYRPVED